MCRPLAINDITGKVKVWSSIDRVDLVDIPLYAVHTDVHCSIIDKGSCWFVQAYDRRVHLYRGQKSRIRSTLSSVGARGIIIFKGEFISWLRGSFYSH